LKGIAFTTIKIIIRANTGRWMAPFQYPSRGEFNRISTDKKVFPISTPGEDFRMVHYAFKESIYVA